MRGSHLALDIFSARDKKNPGGGDLVGIFYVPLLQKVVSLFFCLSVENAKIQKFD